ncbi:hypothetical protein G7058_07290 [Jeotgalibaca porci]|uniref:Uncharacterized protein n=1 Tax=Jeotgalibaca porci TaxID=1868793 RepID=A0A6G7WHU2_9LACT|nr:hypothetical protein [Jeotgalibaca porci]QIK51844.1 hypothetical protein G7058_07290 [Jeotgalibaca porci]
MYKIKNLIDEHEVVWFSVGSNEEIHAQFLSELRELGITWVSGDSVCENDTCSYFMGISSNRKVGHVSWQIWRATWLSEEENPNNRERFYSDGHIPLRVDYEKYSRGELDYLVKENSVTEVSGFLYPVGGRAVSVN